MEEHFRSRYLYDGDWAELAARVCRAVLEGESDADFCRSVHAIVTDQTFVPAGNTLLAGVKPVKPNCCVLGLLTPENYADKLELAAKLWAEGTGVGFNLSGLEDPLKALHELQARNETIDLGHRPARGNMAVLNCTHPAAEAFARCKIVDPEALSRFNISLLVRSALQLEQLLDRQFVQESAWRTGDPGLVFLHTVNVNAKRELHTPVPCGEQFMHAYETCNLGSLNLSAARFRTPQGYFDMPEFKRCVSLAVRFLDRVVDLIEYCDPRLANAAAEHRRIGLGVMGWADLLRIYKYSYCSPEADQLCFRIGRALQKVADATSKQLATEKGACTARPGRRHVTATCVAPTGGIAPLIGLVGCGIEPAFEEAVELHWEHHVATQGRWQYYIENAVSKTVNLPEDATPEDIRKVFDTAQRSGCKGVTVYRNNSRANQPKSLHCSNGSCV